MTLAHRNAQVEMLGMHQVTWRVSGLSKHTHKLFKPDNNSSQINPMTAGVLIPWSTLATLLVTVQGLGFTEKVKP